MQNQKFAPALTNFSNNGNTLDISDATSNRIANLNNKVDALRNANVTGNRPNRYLGDPNFNSKLSILG